LPADVGISEETSLGLGRSDQQGSAGMSIVFVLSLVGSCGAPAPVRVPHGATPVACNQPTAHGKPCVPASAPDEKLTSSGGAVTPNALPSAAVRPAPRLAPAPSYPLPTSPFGIWAHVPWCDMVAKGVYDSRVLVKPGHLGMGGCNGFGVACDIQPPKIRCHHIERGLVACRSSAQRASDQRAAHHSELAMQAASLKVEGRFLVFYAEDGTALFSLHQFIESEGCVSAQEESQVHTGP
jgi:hypothetical protein